MKNIKYASTLSKPATAWEQKPDDRDFNIIPPTPVAPEEEGNWVLLGPGTTLNRNGYYYVLWTWADFGSITKAAAAFGSSLDPDLINLGRIDAEFEGGEETADPEKPDLPVAQEGDHRCGVHSPDGYQCEFAAHEGIMHYNKACGTFVTQVPMPQESSEEPAPLL